MLKGIPSVISPELIKILMEMGHGDVIVLADGNFPAASNAKNLVRADGHNIPEILKAVLKFLPLDIYVDKPIALMETTAGDKEPVIWNEYKSIFNNHGKKNSEIDYIERFEFYKRARNAYAVVATGESSLYANIILKKG
ncbi:MAG: RbsD/FucU family protein, partial [bacterium]